MSRANRMQIAATSPVRTKMMATVNHIKPCKVRCCSPLWASQSTCTQSKLTNKPCPRKSHSSSVSTIMKEWRKNPPIRSILEPPSRVVQRPRPRRFRLLRSSLPWKVLGRSLKRHHNHKSLRRIWTWLSRWKVPHSFSHLLVSLSWTKSQNTRIYWVKPQRHPNSEQIYVVFTVSKSSYSVWKTQRRFVRDAYTRPICCIL